MLAEESGYNGITADQLSTRSGIFSKRLKKNLQRPISTGEILVVDSESQRMLAASVAGKIGQQILTILETFHRDNPLKNGIAKEEP